MKTNHRKNIQRHKQTQRLRPFTLQIIIFVLHLPQAVTIKTTFKVNRLLGTILNISLNVFYVAFRWPCNVCWNFNLADVCSAGKQMFSSFVIATERNN